MASRLLVVLLALAPAAQAETYKWVDERGVVNYSNTPPPAAANAPQQVADRVSTYQTDPALRVAARGVTPYEQMIHEEWLQRQRLMADAVLVKALYTVPVDDGVYYSRPYAYSYGYGYGARRTKASHRHQGRNGAHASHHHGGRR